MTLANKLYMYYTILASLEFSSLVVSKLPDYALYEKKNDKTSLKESFLLDSFPTKRVITCLHQCLISPCCRSVNISPPNNTEQFTCELNNAVATCESFLTSRDGFAYWEETQVSRSVNCIASPRTGLVWDERPNTYPGSTTLVDSRSSISSSALCKQACSEEPRCFAYSWQSSSGLCELWCAAKFQSTGNTNSGWKTGIIVQTSHSNTGLYNRVANAWKNAPAHLYHLSGQVYQGWEGCEGACERTEQCNGYSWASSSAECYLWKSMTIWNNNDGNWNSGRKPEN